jgi:hypothetical protein
MLRIQALYEFEEYFHKQKRLTLDAIGRDSSDQVVDMYIRGFFKQMSDKVGQISQDNPDKYTGTYGVPGYGPSPYRY